MRPVRVRLSLALALGLTALPGRASQPSPLPAAPVGVREELGLEQAEAEELLAGADAALWLPKLRVLRTVAPHAPEALERFLSQADALAGELNGGGLGPWLLKRPTMGPVLPPLVPGLLARSPATPAAVFSDSFESLGNWDLADNRGGTYTFASSTCAARTGSRSADAVRGGTFGSGLSCGGTYPSSTITQITHKTCEALSGASQAWLDFYLSSAMSNSDAIAIGYIPDGTQNYYGYTFSGSWPAWYHIVQSLKQWTTIGDVTTVSCPKLLFQFSSASSPSGFGARVDDVTIGTDTPSFLRATASASPASGPAPLAVSFTGTVAGASGGETYSWRFGDAAGSTSTSQNPSFTYSSAGDYYPRFIVFGNNVLASAQTKVHVDPPCSAVSCTATVPATGTAGTAVAFTSSVSGCSGTPTYAWTFGDGQSAATQSPAHTYTTAGTFPWNFIGAYGSATCPKSGSITITAPASIPGDCNGDGHVDVSEVQKAINMFLGVQAIGCGVDANSNGVIDVSEVQRVINAFLSVSTGITVTVSPASPTIAAGTTQAFTAAVTGTTNTAVTWSVQEGTAGGTISAQGLYTAPQTSGIYHVIAKSQADASKSGSATVTVGASSSQKGIVYGTVKDTSGGALGDVAVVVGSASVSTNGQGYFTMSNVPVADSTLVNFSKTGYVPTSKVIKVSAGQGSYLDVNMMTAKPGQTIDASTGGTVTSGSGSATFPPGAFVTPAGTPHTGQANISVTPFDPTDPAQLNAFPGKFEGVTSGGQTIFFVTFGWMDVTATTTSGSPLKLAPGKTATIKIPVASAIQSAAPATLPEWWYDPATGLWKQEGTFTYSAGAYTGSVSHLSIWNCDVGVDRCTITGRVVDLTGAPVQCARVSMLNLGSRGRFTSGETCTPADGRFSVPVDAGSSVQVTASKGGVSSQTLTTDTCTSGGTRDVGDIVLGIAPVKVTLTWGLDPVDLDTHVAVPKGSGSGWEHLYWNRVGTNVEGTILDTDDTNSYGPEIVTVLSLHTGTYRYCVHHYGGSGTIASSPAAVNLIIEGQGIYTFAPPTGAVGVHDVWRIFDLIVDANKHVTLRPINDYLHDISFSDTTAFFP